MRSAGISLRRSISRLFASRARARLRAQHCEDQGGNAMKLPRRNFLHLAAGAAALPAVSRIARAQAYPSRPVRLVVGFTARRRQRHRRAADGPMAVGAARPAVRRREPARRRQQYRAPRRSCKSPPDGYTLLLVGASNAINATLYEKLNFNFVRDIAPVAGIMPRAAMSWWSIRRSRRRPFPSSSPTPRPIRARLNMASGGNGTRPHVRRAVQDDDRRRHGSRALSRRRRPR